MTGYEKPDESETDTQQGRYLTFAVEREAYGIEIRSVREIVGMQEISNIPESPEYVKGIINLRGNIIPVLDMRLRLKKEPVPYNDRTCIIVIEIGDTAVGLIVDNVAEVVAIGETDVAAPPQLGSGTQSRYIKGIGKIDGTIKLLLDCEKLVSQDDDDREESLPPETSENPQLLLTTVHSFAQ